MGLLAELQRRNVIRMAGLYLIGAWLVAQVVGTVSPMLDSPEWVGRTVLALLAMVFVPALWDQYGPPDLCSKDANGDYRCE